MMSHQQPSPVQVATSSPTAMPDTSLLKLRNNISPQLWASTPKSLPPPALDNHRIPASSSDSDGANTTTVFLEKRSSTSAGAPPLHPAPPGSNDGASSPTIPSSASAAFSGGPVTYADDVAVYRPDKRLNRRYRSYLKSHGVMAFLGHFIPSTVSKADLCKLVLDLGYPKAVLRAVESLTTKEVVKILMNSLLNDRIVAPRVSAPPTEYRFDDFLAQLRIAKKIMVITGAGISTPLGIPDFRSFKGLYTQLKHLNLKDPQEVFNIDTFNRNPNIFYSIAHMILPPEDRFTILHSFIKLLQDKGKLLRNYTQNIDNLEYRIGIAKDKLVQCHGSFGTATCITCRAKYAGSMIFDHIRHKQVPRCFHCYKKVSLNDEVAINYGVIKPDITFFGEELPKSFHRSIQNDMKNCDLVLVIGTSLKVYPVAGITDKIPSHIPRILMNKDDLPNKKFDLKLLGNSDDTASYISKVLGEDWNIPNNGYYNRNDLRIERDAQSRSIYRIK